MPEDISLLDEDELNDLPYRSISNSQSFNPMVQNTIAQRTGMTPRSTSTQDIMADPLMKQYDSQQGDLGQFRQAKLQADSISNLGNAFAQAAQGANTPKPNDDLYKNISDQSKELLHSVEGDVGRRQKIVNAIEARKGREAAVQASMDQRNATRGVQVNRLLGQTEKELREDPIAKPSEINLSSLEKSQALLNNPNLPISSQILSDAEQDSASAMQLRGQGATEGKIKRTELDTLRRRFAEAKQKFGSNIVDLRVEAPELVNQVKKMNQALIDDYKSTIAQRKHDVLDNKEAIWGDDPVFASKLGALRGVISKKFGDRPGAVTPGDETAVARGPQSGGGGSTDSGGIISSAMAGDANSAPHGNTVKQNGVTYQWDGTKYVPSEN